MTDDIWGMGGGERLGEREGSKRLPDCVCVCVCGGGGGGAGVGGGGGGVDAWEGEG